MSPDNENLNEFEILKQVSDGDDSLFSEILKKHSKPLLNFIYRFTLNREEAEDLCQEVFLRLYQNAGRIRPEAAFSTILYKIASNLCIDISRRNKTKNSRLPLLSLDDEPADESGSLERRIPGDIALQPETIIKNREKEEKIRMALQSLPESQRLALVLKTLEDKSYKEIAEIMETTVPAVESLLFRARESLKKILK